MLWERLIGLAEGEIAEVLDALPPPIRGSVDRSVIFLEKRPGPREIEEGFAPDTLGLFEGASMLDGETHEPPRIHLWLLNIWDYCEGDEEAFREEVRVTLAHEIGHLLGMDEAMIEERGLD